MSKIIFLSTFTKKMAYLKKYKKRKTYKKKSYKSRISKNTQMIRKLKNSTMKRTYFKHNDASRVQVVFPNATELKFREFTPIQPTFWNPLFSSMTNTDGQQKILIKKMKVDITLTLGNLTQGDYPIDYSIFIVRIKPQLRAQFYADAGMNGTDLIEGIHYTGDIAPFKPANLLQGATTLENIRLNPEIFDILYYKHGYFSTVIKNSTAAGSPEYRVNKLQVRRCSKTININQTLKSDSYTLAGTPNRSWKELEEQEIPLWMRTHIYTFTSAERGTAAYIEQTGLQQNIQCLFTCESAN